MTVPRRRHCGGVLLFSTILAALSCDSSPPQSQQQGRQKTPDEMLIERMKQYGNVHAKGVPPSNLEIDPNSSGDLHSALLLCGQLTTLEVLNITGYDGLVISQSDVDLIVSIKRLIGVNVFGCDISAQSLASFRRISNLSIVGLNGRQINDSHLAAISSLQLSNLHISDTQISNQGLQYLSHMNTLQELVLDGINIGDAGLEHLKRLTNLKSLYVSRTKITESGVEILRQHLPNLDVKCGPL